MPLIVDSARGPVVWAPAQQFPTERRGDDRVTLEWAETDAAHLRIALVNNMPDQAFEETESQFFDLLHVSSGSHVVRARLFSVPHRALMLQGNRHGGGAYRGIDELMNSRFDAIIVTGAVPGEPELCREAYWPGLASVLDWAAENTVSAMLSCLAAHAGVYHGDGIVRKPLTEKRFGVFRFHQVSPHALTAGNTMLCCPHSRWNEVRPDELAQCGYAILSHSDDAGVDLFVKKRGKSLFVHSQGHPEYGALTLLKEYRRDVRRFLKGEQHAYPAMPQGYFHAATIALLNEFRQSALSLPGEKRMDLFPDFVAGHTLQHRWRESAVSVYRNWLEYVAAAKAGSHSLSGEASKRFCPPPARKAYAGRPQLRPS